MNKKIIFIALFLSLFSYSYSDEKNFLLSFSFNSNPFLYDSVNSGYIYSLIGNINIGFNYKKFAFLIDMSQNHFRYNQIFHTYFYGYFNILNSSINFQYLFTKNILLRWGMGFGWQRVDFFQKGENVVLDYFSPLTKFDIVLFFDNRYLNLEIINLLNIFIAQNTILPFYNTIFRINIYPSIEFLHFFIDTGVLINRYKSDNFEANSLIFLWSLGIKFELIFPEMIKKKKIERIPLDEQNFKEIEKIEEYSKEIVEEKLIISEKEIFKERFLKTNKDEIISINILFTDEIITDEKSLELLQWLIEFLKENDKIIIAIGAYAEFSGKPDFDLTKSKKRANFIKDYLVRNGINNERIKIFASGRVYDNKIKDSEKMVDIKILRK